MEWPELRSKMMQRELMMAADPTDATFREAAEASRLKGPNAAV